MRKPGRLPTAVGQVEHDPHDTSGSWQSVQAGFTVRAGVVERMPWPGNDWHNYVLDVSVLTRRDAGKMAGLLLGSGIYTAVHITERYEWQWVTSTVSAMTPAAAPVTTAE